jgi:hypothetical protein
MTGEITAMLTVLILVITLALATLGIWGMISIAISGWLDGAEESLDARLDETCKNKVSGERPDRGSRRQ